jgi:putative ABC transport system permease protein
LFCGAGHLYFLSGIAGAGDVHGGAADEGVRYPQGAGGEGRVRFFTLLSKDFLVLVLVAFVVATPLAGWAMHVWLQNYAYHIGLEWWVFVLAGAMALLIALVTVSFQAIRVAIANPVKSLRTE